MGFEGGLWFGLCSVIYDLIWSSLVLGLVRQNPSRLFSSRLLVLCTLFSSSLFSVLLVFCSPCSLV